jgi:hypothetical protein
MSVFLLCPEWPGHTGSVTTTTASTQPGRSGPEIRAALAHHAPADVHTFEREFQHALSEAATSYDTRNLDDVIDRWWGIAVIRSITVTEAEQEQLDRASAGDFTGMLEKTADGSFRRIG